MERRLRKSRMRVAEPEPEPILYLQYDEYYTIAENKEQLRGLMLYLPQGIDYRIGEPPLHFQQFVEGYHRFVTIIKIIVRRENVFDRIEDQFEENPEMTHWVVDDDDEFLEYGAVYFANRSVANVLENGRRLSRGNLGRYIIVDRAMLREMYENGRLSYNFIFTRVDDLEVFTNEIIDENDGDGNEGIFDVRKRLRV